MYFLTNIGYDIKFIPICLSKHVSFYNFLNMTQVQFRIGLENTISMSK